MLSLRTRSPRIAVIGFGSMALKHVTSIFKISPGAQIAVLTSQTTVPDFPNFSVSFHSEISEVLEFKPEFAVIATSANRHGDYIDHLLRLGTEVLIEKPLSSNSRDAKLIQVVSKRYKSKPKVAYNLRFSGGLNVLKNVLREQIIGQVLSVQSFVGQNLERWRPGRALGSTVSTSRLRGGGVLRELSHELDYLRLLFGRATYHSALLGMQKFRNFDVEDTAMILMHYNEWSSNIMASLNLDFTRNDQIRQCHVIGENGSIRWNALEGKVLLFKDGQEQMLFDDLDDLSQTNLNMWRCWLEGKTDRFASLNDGLDVITDIETIERISKDCL